MLAWVSHWSSTVTTFVAVFANGKFIDQPVFCIYSWSSCCKKELFLFHYLFIQLFLSVWMNGYLFLLFLFILLIITVFMLLLKLSPLSFINFSTYISFYKIINYFCTRKKIILLISTKLFSSNKPNMTRLTYLKLTVVALGREHIIYLDLLLWGLV